MHSFVMSEVVHPGEHWSHVDSTFEAEVFPAGQYLHSFVLDWSAKDSAGQTAHVFALEGKANLPGVHSVHTVAPATPANVPGLHGEHVEPPLPLNWPGWQASHADTFCDEL